MRRLFATKAEVVLAARSVSPLVIAVVLAADTAWTLIVWTWVYPSGLPAQVTAATHGVVGFTLATCAPAVAIMFALVFGLGRLRLRDLGLSRRGLVVGVLAAFAIWALAQIILVIRAAVTGAPLVHEPFALAEMLGQLFGNALGEEVLWRGFLWVQIVLLVRRFTSARASWIIGLGVMAILFSLSHLPGRVVHDEHGGLLAADLVGLVLGAVVFAFAYVRTGHLEVAIVVHALWDVPLPIIASQYVDHAVTIAVELVLIIVWPYVVDR